MVAGGMRSDTMPGVNSNFEQVKLIHERKLYQYKIISFGVVNSNDKAVTTVKSLQP